MYSFAQQFGSYSNTPAQRSEQNEEEDTISEIVTITARGKSASWRVINLNALRRKHNWNQKAYDEQCKAMEDWIQGLVEQYGDLLRFYDFSHYFPNYSNMTKFNNYQKHQTFTLEPQTDTGETAELVQETREKLHSDSQEVSKVEKEEDND